MKGVFTSLLILEILSHTIAIKPAANHGTFFNTLFNDDYDNVAKGPDVTPIPVIRITVTCTQVCESPVFTLVAITWVNHCTCFV